MSQKKKGKWQNNVIMLKASAQRCYKSHPLTFHWTKQIPLPSFVPKSLSKVGVGIILTLMKYVIDI